MIPVRGRRGVQRRASAVLQTKCLKMQSWGLHISLPETFKLLDYGFRMYSVYCVSLQYSFKPMTAAEKCIFVLALAVSGALAVAVILDLTHVGPLALATGIVVLLAGGAAPDLLYDHPVSERLRNLLRVLGR